jgi:chorismate synthase
LEIASILKKEFAVLDEEQGIKMREIISRAKEQGDSVGGTIECVVVGVPVGLGDPIFDGVESIISQMMFSIPAVKGVEFGAGFGLATMRGSSANDAPTLSGGRITYKTNNNGGVLGGISNGMPIVFRAAIKPTASIAAKQETVDLLKKENTTLKITGRHDSCIVPRAVEVVRCGASLCLADLLLEDKKYG